MSLCMSMISTRRSVTSKPTASRVMGDPTVSRGPSEGQRWVYFRAPWGLQFELVSYPGGKAFDRAGGTASTRYGGGVDD